jgi:hypothetical protein
MSVSITCTKQAGTTISAQASALSALTWTLEVTPSGGGPVQTFNGTDVVLPSGVHTVTFTNVPDGTYQVAASSATGMSDSQPVPFGTCP